MPIYFSSKTYKILRFYFFALGVRLQYILVLCRLGISRKKLQKKITTVMSPAWCSESTEYFNVCSGIFLIS